MKAAIEENAREGKMEKITEKGKAGEKQEEKQKKEKLEKAKRIAEEAIVYAKSIIEKGSLLIDVAEKIEEKISQLGGKPAFPTNLCIDDVAAHYTPTYNDETKATGLLKVDIGVHIKGYIADFAFSLNLADNEEESRENEKLIQASKDALDNAIKMIKKDIELWEIGKTIQDIITKYGFSPIRNLSGHELRQYNLHAGLTLPNCNNNNKTRLPEGVYAIEPFATTGQGIVYEGKGSGIYKLVERKSVREPLARKILDFIENEYKTLPFCSRWLVNKFSTRALFSLRQLENIKILHQFPQLIEKAHGKVSQAEKTLIIE